MARDLFRLDEVVDVPVLGHPVAQDGAADPWEPAWRALRGETVLNYEVELPGAGSTPQRHALVSAAPILDGQQVRFVAVVAADVTALRQFDRQRDEFIAVAAHELKSPLTSLKGFAQLLQRRMRGTPDETRYRTALETIDMQVNRLVSMIDRLLSVSRAQMGRLVVHPEPADLAELVREQVHQARHRTGMHELTLDVAGAATGRWDTAQLRQVVDNLLDNAIRYSPHGGEVAVSVRRDADRVQLRVSDQGIGISAEVLPRLFSRYVRAEEAKRVSAEGLGVGLYISREIVAAHGGRIWAESEPQHGSTFVVELPLEPQPGLEQSRPPEHMTAAPPGSLPSRAGEGGEGGAAPA
jgi:signal transduction histidine kinase